MHQPPRYITPASIVAGVAVAQSRSCGHQAAGLWQARVTPFSRVGVPRTTALTRPQALRCIASSSDHSQRTEPLNCLGGNRLPWLCGKRSTVAVQTTTLRGPGAALLVDSSETSCLSCKHSQCYFPLQAGTPLTGARRFSLPPPWNIVFQVCEGAYLA